MAQQTPDPKLIDSMAMRYRHDFGLLEEPHKESIRITMKQLWEEVVGLGFYKDEQFGNSEQLAQQTAVEWFIDYLEEHLLAYDMKINIKQTEAYIWAKEMDKQQKKYAWVDGNGTQMCITSKDVDECFDDYYNETYGKW
jgi:hypothetical protein